MSRATHPIDAAIRKTLRTLSPQQTDLARRIGRSQGWLNKYLNGVGKATIDDVVRLVALVVLGLERPPALSAEERRLVEMWRTLLPATKTEVRKYLALLRTRDTPRPANGPNRTAGRNHGPTTRPTQTRPPTSR